MTTAVRMGSMVSTAIVFSSTGGALYSDVETLPTPEEFAKNPESPYGNAKFSVELYMGYYARVHGLQTVALRYGNVYGPRQDSHGEAGVVSIFCEEERVAACIAVEFRMFLLMLCVSLL